MLLWLWQRPAAAALIRPLAWEPPHAGVALKRTKDKTKTKTKRNKQKNLAVLIMAQQKQILLGTMRLQVKDPALP